MMKTKGIISTKDQQGWFQDSPHKQHYETFLESGLSEVLNIVFSANAVSRDGDYLIKYEFQEPDFKNCLISEPKTVWNIQSPNGISLVESFPGYRQVNVPLSITIAYKGNDIEKARHILSFRKLPLIDPSGTFWWGETGKEFKRVPIGLIRYAPGPLLHEVRKKDMEVSQFQIRGEFGPSVGIELHKMPSLKSEEEFLRSLKGKISFGRVKISLPEVFGLLAKDERCAVFKFLSIKAARSKTKYLPVSNEIAIAFQKAVSELYLSELGRNRLEYNFSKLFGKDYVTVARTKETNYYLTIKDIALVIIGLAKNWDSIPALLDDKLHLSNRRVLLLHHMVAKSIFEGVRSAFNRTIKGKDVLERTAKRIDLSSMLSLRWLDRYIKKATQKADATNSLSLLAQSRKLTFAGPGGIKISHSSSDIRVRDIHPTHYGRICIVETTEGKGVGLNLQLAAVARVRYNGEIETPYRLADGDKPEWFSAFDEVVRERDSNKPFDIAFLDDSYSKNEIIVHSHCDVLKTVIRNKYKLPEDVSFTQPYGLATLLIPFLKHCDGTRAMMGAKNVKQALVLKNPEAPVVMTGAEKIADITFNFGINALVAYMPWKGFNFEDGIVCSESFAKRMTTIHQNKVVIKIFFGDSLIPCGNSPTWKPVGSSINPGDIIFCKENPSKIQKKTNIRSEFAGVLTKIERIALMHPILTVSIDEPFELYRAIINQERPLRVGDKIMGRHGNKGVISLILSDHEMPHLQDGTPIEVMLNPNGVISRMNLSQILETHWGWIAKNSTDKTFIFPPYQGPSAADLQNELKKVPFTDATGKVSLKFKVDGEDMERQIVVGLQYVMKLNHLAEDKLKFRTKGRYNQLTGGAVRGDDGGQRIGEMEFWALRSFGADAIISEICKIKNLTDSDDLPRTSSSLNSILKAVGIVAHYENRTAYYRMAESDEIPSWGPAVEAYYNYTPKQVKVAACKLCRRPITVGACSDCENEVKVSLSKKWIVEGECSCRSKRPIGWKCICGCSSAFYLSINTWENNEKGLLDPELFGKKENDKYTKQFGYLKLNVPVLNPLFALNIGRNEDKKIIQGKATYVVDEKNCNERLEEVDYYKLSSFSMKQSHLLSPTEAFARQFSDKYSKEDFSKLILNNIPLIPLAFRDPGKTSNDLHKAYNLIIKLNNQIENAQGSVRIVRLSLSLQRAVYNLFWGDERGDRGGLTGRIKGREGLIRSAMIARRVDFSARAVIVPAPELPMDECLLPRRFKTLFDSHEYQCSALQKRVLIHRAATLHKYNILSFKVRDFWDEDVIGLPPLVCGYMNADFDGDTVAVHLPLSRAANDAALRMSPDNYLFGYASGSFMPHITQDIVLGLYLLARSADGRLKIAEIIQQPAESISHPLTGSKLRELCAKFARHHSNQVAARGLLELSLLGFRHATLSGATFSIFDVPAISLKERLELKENDSDQWRDKVSEALQALSYDLAGKSADNGNGVAWMIVSGARGAKDQIVQLGGMRGSMFRPGDNNRINVPVIGNFREGLKGYEYWISAPGTRKGMIDKHINTQPAGILHRKLVETGYPLGIVMRDCKTQEGIVIYRDWHLPEGLFLGKAQSNAGSFSFAKRILGRTLFEPVKLRNNRKAFPAKGNSAIAYALAEAIDSEQTIDKVILRSPLLCKAKGGICSKCYGLSLDRSEPQKIGTPVGLIAGHIIGERGVQLAMRTFHTGGASVSEVISTLPWVRKFLGAKPVELPLYDIAGQDCGAGINRWEFLTLLLKGNVTHFTEIKGKSAKLSINDFLSRLGNSEQQPDLHSNIGRSAAIWSLFMHAMSFEILSIYSGDIAPIHFETLFRAMRMKDGTLAGIFSKAGEQGSVLAAASHDRAVQRIFKAAMTGQKDTKLPWREKFIRGLI